MTSYAVRHVFGNAPLPQAARDVIVRANDEAWKLILRGEVCAIPLVERLREHGVYEGLPPSALSVIAHAQLEEIQRVMAARGVLREVDLIASHLGIRVAVLKGGALVRDPQRTPVDLGDVDVLLSPAEAKLLWQSLVERGWQAGTGLHAPDADWRYRGNHYGALSSPQDNFKLELHVAIRYFSEEDYGLRIARRPISWRGVCRCLASPFGYHASLSTRTIAGPRAHCLGDRKAVGS